MPNHLPRMRVTVPDILWTTEDHYNWLLWLADQGIQAHIDVSFKYGREYVLLGDLDRHATDYLLEFERDIRRKIRALI